MFLYTNSILFSDSNSSSSRSSQSSSGIGSNSFSMTIEKVGDLIHQNCIFTILVIGGSISLSEDALATFGRERFSPVTSLLQIWDWKHLRVHMGHLGAFCSQPGGRGQMGPSHGPSLHFMGGNGGGVRPTNPLRRAEIRVEMPRPRGISGHGQVLRVVPIVDDRGSHASLRTGGWGLKRGSKRTDSDSRKTSYALLSAAACSSGCCCSMFLRTSGKSGQLKFISPNMNRGVCVTHFFKKLNLITYWQVGLGVL